MASETPPTPFLLFTDPEAEVLGLYDKLQQLQLKLALLRSQQSHHASRQSPSLASDQPTTSLEQCVNGV